MLTPTYVNISSFFYPIGNTTAVCLTQNLSPEQRANVLLLGCGDARNILFTSYCENLQNDRKLDFTCCDLQEAVIARNIVLFTLLVDDSPSTNNDTVIWQIYYHFKLEEKAIKLLQSHSEKLCRLATSMQSWQASDYSTLLRFCDENSLSKVREVWSFYAKATGGGRDGFDKKFKADIQQSLKWKQRLMGDSGGLIMTGVRSAAPTGIEAMEELPKFHEHYWNHGITEESTQKKNRATFSNPMFSTMDADNSVIHYGSDSILGFHLATAYMPLDFKSPLRPKLDPNACKAVHAARAQFQAWAAAFKKLAHQNLKIRFVVGDALALCHSLKYKVGAQEDERANCILEPLLLDGDYYKSGKAAHTFNVIDTSNLADHVGIVNLLVATAPLLERSPWSIIYAELLVKQEDDHQALRENLLCGDFMTVSALLGLFPVEFFSNATAISNADEAIMDVLSKSSGQHLQRLAWKSSRAAFSGGKPHLDQQLHFHEEDLAHLLHHVYAVMFRHENMARLLAMDRRNIIRLQLVFYHRGCFGRLLQHVKNVSKVEWPKMMALLLTLIEKDRSSLMGAHYYQEFYAYLHLLGLANLPVVGTHVRVSLDKISDVHPSSAMTRTPTSSDSKGLCAWKEIPPVVCVTLKVPRAKLNVLTSVSVHELGTPLVHCVIQAPPMSRSGEWHDIFCAMQLSFGTISTSGDRNGDDLQLQIKEDGLNWRGKSPLMVSFYVPSNVILEEPSAARISFGLVSNPHNLHVFLKKLGMELNVFETILGDQEHVFVTKFFPNRRGHTSICPRVTAETNDVENEEVEFLRRTTAHVFHSRGVITSFTGRIDFISDTLKSALAGKAVVKTLQLSPRTIQIDIGENGKHILHFPTHVLNSQAKTRIARKSSYIEVTVPVASHAAGTGFPNFMYPLFVTDAEPALWNMPFLSLDSLPIINVAKKEDLQWLTPHTSLQMSARERRSREHDMATPGYIQKDVRINFKDAIFSMFMNFTGLQGPQRMRTQCLFHPEKGGVNIIIFISELRLDVGNRTALLDTVVLPLTHAITPRISKFLASFAQMKNNLIKVDDEELALWKQVIPAYVERCRTWKHLPTCEYNKTSKIPLSTEYAEPFLCSCGNGSVPPNFIKDIPHFNTVCKYSVRAAISPSYAVPFVEKMVSIDDLEKVKKVKDQEVKSGNKGIQKCGNCERTKHVNGEELAFCSRCRKVKYCSKECQKAAWNVHKKVCVKAEEAKGVSNGGGAGKDDGDLSALVKAMESEGLD